MAEVSYLKLKNTTTGEEVKGDCEESKYKDWIEIQALDHEISRPTHPQTGKVTGETMHGALCIVKPLDKASPLLQQGLSSGHYFEGEIHFQRTAPQGNKEHWFTIKFKRASLVKVRIQKPSALEVDSRLPDLEDVHFRYEVMSWRHEKAGKEYEYDWNKR